MSTLTMSLNQYKKFSNLGEGTFGKVVLGYKDNEPFTLKFIENESEYDLLETDILKDIKDIKGVVKYVEHYDTPKETIIINEYSPGTDLFTFICSNGPLGDKIVLKIFRQFCMTMSQVHALGIVHRDLKPENIIINKQLETTIIDWGLAFYPEKTTIRQVCGSPAYAAPELVTKKRTYNGPELDVWALGCILYALKTASMPFYDDDVKVLFSLIRKIRVDYSRHGLTKDSRSLLRKIFVRAEERITINEILEHLKELGAPPLTE